MNAKPSISIISKCSLKILCLPGIIFFLLLSYPSEAQENRLNLSRYRHIISDTLARVRVETTDNANQPVTMNTTLSDFRYSENMRSAVISNGTETRHVESRGKVPAGREFKTIKGIVLPELHIGSTSDAGQTLLFQILIDNLQPLIFDNQSKIYKGSFNIILLEDSETTLSGKLLSTPVPVEISAGGRAQVEPSKIQIDHTNLPSTTINITDASTDDTVPVLIKTNFNLKGYNTYMNKEAVLRIDTPPRSVQGMGIQTIPVNISIVGYTAKDSVNVSFHLNKGSVEPMNLKIAEGMTGTVKLTSEGTGVATLNVTAPGFRNDQQDFIYVFPWLFLLFTFLGSLSGVLISFRTKKKQKSTFSEFGTGILTGFVFAILFYVLSIEVLEIKLPRAFNEFAVFGISFLGVIFWNRIYDLLQNKLFGGKG